MIILDPTYNIPTNKSLSIYKIIYNIQFYKF
jgi:hypothetical protein